MGGSEASRVRPVRGSEGSRKEEEEGDSVRGQAPEFLRLCLRRLRPISDQLRWSWTRNTLYYYSNHSLARYINRLSTEPDGFGIEFNNSYSGPILSSYQVLGLSHFELDLYQPNEYLTEYYRNCSDQYGLPSISIVDLRQQLAPFIRQAEAS